MKKSEVPKRKFKRLDTIVFLGAFFLGAGAYFVLNFVLQTKKIVIAGAIILIMILYAIISYLTPRIKVRLDQAGDNSYYLGLLFTLISMASALAQYASLKGQKAGIEIIIYNFGIALSSTIIGILLRVTLHHMRVDPSEVEEMTRLELSEASKKVQATINQVSNDLGRFHETLQQRSSDVFNVLVESANDSTKRIADTVEAAAEGILKSTGTAQANILKVIADYSDILTKCSTSAQDALVRLSKFEEPPIKLVKRFESISLSVENSERGLTQASTAMSSTSESIKSIVDKMSIATVEMGTQIDVFIKSNNTVHAQIESSSKYLRDSLEAIGNGLKIDRELLIKIEEEFKNTVDSSTLAQRASIEMLEQLTTVAKKLTETFRH